MFAVDAVGRDMGTAGPGMGDETRNTAAMVLSSTVSGLDKFHVSELLH